MNKFMSQILIITLILYGIWFSLSSLYPFPFKGSEYYSWRHKYDAIDKLDLNNCILIMGDSTGEAGVDPNLLGKGCIYNLSLPGGTLFDSYIMVKRIIKRGIKPKKIILIYSLANQFMDDGFLSQNINFHLYSSEEVEDVLSWQRKNQFLMKNILSYKNLTSYAPYKSILNTNTNQGLYNIGKLEYFLSGLHLSLIDLSRFKHYILRYQYKDFETHHELELFINELKTNRGHINYLGVKDNELIYDTRVFEGNDFSPHSLTLHYLKKAIRLLSENHISTALDSTPIPLIYIPHMHKNFLKKGAIYYDKLRKKYNTQVLEHFNIYKDDFFIDQVHLNKEGCKRYSNYLKERYIDNQ